MFRARLAYSRHLLRTERWSESQRQLERLTQEQPSALVPAESWLLLGALQMQNKKLGSAKASFETFLKVAGSEGAGPSVNGRNQAYMSLAQIAEESGDLDAASRWLDQASDEDDSIRITVRRAALLVKAGRWQDAVQLIRGLPDKPEDNNKSRWIAEAQVLRDAGQVQTAYDRLTEALAVLPNDTELLYEQATLAEKLGRHSDMELLLRQVLRLEPDHHHAMNFLGYSMADRGDRLPEAKALIQKALSHSPNDPFITDSLGWVEFKLGNTAVALELLQQAFANRPDAEIALHLAEVLWASEKRDESLQMFRKADQLQPGNPLLLPVIRRLGVPWP
jgi:tetratricopeptide (TPR) repeat protein